MFPGTLKIPAPLFEADKRQEIDSALPKSLDRPFSKPKVRFFFECSETESGDFQSFG